MKWLKFYAQDWMTDIKVNDLSAIDRLFYITLLCLADENGVIRGFSESRVIKAMQLSPRDFKMAIESHAVKNLADNGMITVMGNGDCIIPRFRERQTGAMTGYERVKKNREKNRKYLEIKGLFDNDNADDNSHDNVNDNVETRIDKTRIDKTTLELKHDFEMFWGAFPKKLAKQDALRAFVNVNPSPEMLAQMIAAIEVQKKTQSWMKSGGQYIPYPATWLNNRRWEDEVRPSSMNSPIKIA